MRGRAPRACAPAKRRAVIVSPYHVDAPQQAAGHSNSSAGLLRVPDKPPHLCSRSLHRYTSVSAGAQGARSVCNRPSSTARAHAELGCDLVFGTARARRPASPPENFMHSECTATP